MLSDKQKAKLRAAATAEGVDADALIAAADNGDESPPTADGPNGKGEVGFYAFQHPYMTVNEIRQSMGLPSITDGGAFSGDWLARHGGPKPSPSGNGEE